MSIIPQSNIEIPVVTLERVNVAMSFIPSSGLILKFPEGGLILVTLVWGLLLTIFGGESSVLKSLPERRPDYRVSNDAECQEVRF